MTIHKEGYTTLLLTIAFLVVINGLVISLWPQIDWLQYGVWTASILFFLLILQFFRSPKVVTEQNPNQLIAPADGKVVVIEETVEPEFQEAPCRQISIFMSPVNVHVNRAPASGTVQYFKYHKGKYLMAWDPKSSSDNERTSMAIKTDKGPTIFVKQIAGFLARRIRWYVEEGQSVQQGAEFGFIKFGSRVDVLIPLDAEVKVTLNQTTTAGKTVIAEFK